MPNTDGGRPIPLLPFSLSSTAGFLPGARKYWVKDGPFQRSLPAERGGQRDVTRSGQVGLPAKPVGKLAQSWPALLRSLPAWNPAALLRSDSRALLRPCVALCPSVLPDQGRPPNDDKIHFSTLQPPGKHMTRQSRVKGRWLCFRSKPRSGARSPRGAPASVMLFLKPEGTHRNEEVYCLT